MVRDLGSLVRPERPPGDRVLTVILTSVFAAVVAGSRPTYERLTGAVAAALYTVLAVAFAVARRRRCQAR
jgi:hypothetical protein